jgi:hypothetical protein
MKLTQTWMQMRNTTSVDDFSIIEFSSNGISHRVYRKGAGPDVLVMHELPRMTPQFINIARTVADAGFTVHLPLFFSEPGENHAVLFLVRLCISREFRLFARRDGSPIVDWLRAYGHEIFSKNGGKEMALAPSSAGSPRIRARNLTLRVT